AQRRPVPLATRPRRCRLGARRLPEPPWAGPQVGARGTGDLGLGRRARRGVAPLPQAARLHLRVPGGAAGDDPAGRRRRRGGRLRRRAWRDTSPHRREPQPALPVDRRGGRARGAGRGAPGRAVPGLRGAPRPLALREVLAGRPAPRLRPGVAVRL
ncbi:MAG: Universal stress protein UspA and related nucleotide-binding proteins, partial [uncultured Thermomicrobiales bacterium]